MSAQYQMEQAEKKKSVKNTNIKSTINPFVLFDVIEHCSNLQNTYSVFFYVIF